MTGRPVRGERRRAGHPAAAAGHDARLLERPRALPGRYWSRWPGTWVHGDWAIDRRRRLLVHPRAASDDTLKIAGKRVGPAEVESAAVAHPAVLEAAAIGVPHEIKGEAIVVFVRPAAGRDGRRDAAGRRSPTRSSASWASRSGPRRSLSSRRLPKTRSRQGHATGRRAA